MDIYKDIERATHIPYVDDNATFYRRKQPRYRPAPRRPRNAELLEECPDHYSEKECMLDLPKTINPIEIATSIRMATGAISCSNEEVEEYWRSRQMERNSSEEESAKILQDDAAFAFVKKGDSCNISSNSGSGELSQTRNCELINAGEDVQQEETVLKSCKLDRNAAIKGLIKSNMISLKDLTVPDENNYVNPDIAMGYSNTETGQANPLFENAKGLTYVPSPHDPDILITPLQAYGIDESKHKGIDFTVPRLGTKTAVTSVEYLIYGIDDDSFNFVQKKSTREKK